MTKFDDNLWREVQDSYGPELSQAPGPLQSASRLRRPVLAGTSLGVVGASTAAVIILTAASTPPAFAVTKRSDGTVSVLIRRVEGIPGANRRLAELGIHARTVRVADGCQVVAAPAMLRAVAVATLARNGHSNWIGARAGTVKAEIRPAQIPSGRTLVIPAVRAGRVVQLVRGRAVRGAVPACLPPAVSMWTRGGVVRTIACRAGTPLHAIPLHAFPPGVEVRPPDSAPAPATNTTATNASPPPATVTETTVGPGTETNSGTATNSGTETHPGTATNSGTETNSGTATNSGTTPSSGPAGPITVKVPPPLVRACRLARRAATR